ncbi:MAG: hypothetical protein WCP06_04380 [Verrucomicrobiota bacterium]
MNLSTLSIRSVFSSAPNAAARFGFARVGRLSGRAAILIVCAGLGLQSAQGELPPSLKGLAAPTPPAASDSAPVTVASLLGQVQARLKGVPITQAPADDLVKAVEKVVGANPKEAVAILAAVLAVQRPDMWELTGKIVAAAIRGLGPTATSPMIVNLVQIAIELQPAARLATVHYAALETECAVLPYIVQAAGRRIAVDRKNVVVRDRKNVVDFSDKNVVETETDLTRDAAQTAVDARPDCYPTVDALRADISKEMPAIEEGGGDTPPQIPTDPNTPPHDIKPPVVSK